MKIWWRRNHSFGTFETDAMSGGRADENKLWYTLMIKQTNRELGTPWIIWRTSTLCEIKQVWGEHWTVPSHTSSGAEQIWGGLAQRQCWTKVSVWLTGTDNQGLCTHCTLKGSHRANEIPKGVKTSYAVGAVRTMRAPGLETRFVH